VKEILEAGGAGFLLPAVLFVLVLYAIRGVFGLHVRRGQNRREFLELWDRSRCEDDLWLEVSVRHLFGTYLPARVIRLALEQPDRSRALLDLAEIWDLLVFSPEDQTVRWNRTLQSWVARSRWGRALCFAAYFVCASAAVMAGVFAAHWGHTSFAGWVYGVCAVVVGFLAIICLTHEETVKTAAHAGKRWVPLINRTAVGAETNRESNTPLLVDETNQPVASRFQ
jgi:hypothetical protein